MPEDDNHLEYLKIGHYVLGGLGMLFGCMPLFHVAVGLAVVNGSFSHTEQVGTVPPDAFGWVFVFMGGLFFLLGQACAIGTIISGRFIEKRKNYLFTFIVACILCVFFPFGTVLGILTIIVLSRDSVKHIYGKV